MKNNKIRPVHKIKEPTCNYDPDLPDTLVADTIYRNLLKRNRKNLNLPQK